ncbi:Acidic mammalian chitinase-like [Aphelenchoides bicaudatus]|nr:Acidic mammalian chitinase-like [Aphelenchoides bicaudatus]
MVAFKLALAILMIGSVNAQIRGCYYEDWSRGRSPPGQFNKAEQYIGGLCSHVFYAFAQINGLGVSGPSGGYPAIKKFKEHNPSLKILLSIGGDGTASSFQQLVANPANVATWAKNAVKYAKNNGFDGLDIDWEFPDNQKTQFTNLLKQIRNNGPKPFLLTAAVAPGISNHAVSAYDIGAIRDTVDFLNVMTYDFMETSVTGSNAPLGNPMIEWNIAYTIQWYLNQGMPSSKLILGIATYGKGKTLTTTNKQGMGVPVSGVASPAPITKDTMTGTRAQYELCKWSGSTSTWDANTKTPYIQNGNQWYSYENVQSVTEKINFAKSKNLGGAFIWALDLDDFSNYCGNGKYPIMNTINKLLIGKAVTG